MGKTKTSVVSEEKGKKNMKKKEDSKVHIAGLKGGQRVKAIEATPVTETNEAIEAKKVKKEKIRSKKYQEVRAKIDRNRLYPVSEAIKLVKETSFSKFDGTLEVHLVVKKTGMTANVSLPFSAGKQKKVEVADEKTIEKLKTGKVDFDVLLATAEMMPKLVAFARILGPKGMMPNPKNGTLIKDAKDAAKFSGNTVTLKTEKDFPLIHTIAGKVSQKETELEQNVESILNSVGKKQILKAYLKSTMSPSVKINL